MCYHGADGIATKPGKGPRGQGDGRRMVDSSGLLRLSCMCDARKLCTLGAQIGEPLKKTCNLCDSLSVRVRGRELKLAAVLRKPSAGEV